ncbi:putative flagellar basal-body P-ring formation protein FlgA [Roseobacter sp. AzwK-3b]|uniref:flagellar basal body P-ring formation chaperone FlgA n=1 Tax=Roseobacter sp. AzwK-3b TaxID=351016 RepID=UPI000156992D|nr:flagellar basal body P-ring formation chaperone FlgA [Roseobacter sp. AzwK-3b]EDM73067.1 putative flagellar basal-body P-ring formation protein FlgA [Roseobacter sp. AzwK-3b]
MIFRVSLILLLAAGPVSADMIVAARTIRPQEIITLGDVGFQAGEIAGIANRLDQVIGQEARVALYAGRPIRLTDIGEPAVVDRNQMVSLIFESHGLRIATEGRALDRAGVGEMIRVMNMSSRATVSGEVLPDGRIRVMQ